MIIFVGIFGEILKYDTHHGHQQSKQRDFLGNQDGRVCQNKRTTRNSSEMFFPLGFKT